MRNSPSDDITSKNNVTASIYYMYILLKILYDRWFETRLNENSTNRSFGVIKFDELVISRIGFDEFTCYLFSVYRMG